MHLRWDRVLDRAWLALAAAAAMTVAIHEGGQIGRRVWPLGSAGAALAAQAAGPAGRPAHAPGSGCRPDPGP